MGRNELENRLLAEEDLEAVRDAAQFVVQFDQYFGLDPASLALIETTGHHQDIDVFSVHLAGLDVTHAADDPDLQRNSVQ